MSTRIDHYNNNNNGGNGGGGGQPSPNSPTASFAPAQSTSFPPRSSSMRQLPAPTTTNGHSNGSNTMAQDAVSLDPAPGTTYAQFLRTWTDAHVARWLVDNKCGHQAQTFSVNDIRGDILLELDQTTLKEMGISSIGDRLRIMNALKALRQKCSSRVIVSPVVDTSKVTVANHSRTPSSIDSSGSPTSKPGSNSTRRLEAGRPAPLQIPRESSQGLPRLDRAGDSSRPRPLPFPTPTTATPQSYSMNGSGGASSSSSSLVGSSTPQGASGTPISQSGRGQGLQPQSASSRTQPGSTAVRQNGRNVNLAPNHGGYRTPTNAELNTYNNAPLPPAPGPPPGWFHHH
jgi:mitogen-activated protein kinase kinase kinase